MAENRKLLLSFDDGPEPTGALGEILRLLASNRIKAEFYVLGSEVERSGVAATQIVIQGHKIQNHSWKHDNLATASETAVKEDLEKTQKVILEKTGARPNKVRPPGGNGGWPGNLDPELSAAAGQLRLQIQNWDVDTEDWKNPRGVGPAKLENVKRQLSGPANRGKAVLNVLMHVQKETAADLQSFIDFLKQSGFAFANP
jgi:peptidoglycan/xylan/chitin deacetylase (PgdA/CDA1 family)